MIEYRTFQNGDPPQVAELWENSGLGRGAAGNLRTDAFEYLNFAQPYFDRAGLILACEEENVVGMVHAGFGVNEDQTNLDQQTGVICMVLVHPDFRRQGIGRELVRKAEAYLRDRGAATIFAGQAEPLDSFYFGMYGGSQPSGFLLSDSAADPFFRSVGYAPFERHAIFQRDLCNKTDPVNMRLAGVRRKTQLAIAYQRQPLDWWWITRLGRLDTVRFHLVGRGDNVPVAEVTVLGLDLYLDRWQERAIGLTNLEVADSERQQGYGQALLVEVCRRMREEMVTRVEAHASETNSAAMATLKSAGFEQVDTGVVYRLLEDGESVDSMEAANQADGDNAPFDDGETAIQPPVFDQQGIESETTLTDIGNLMDDDRPTEIS
ncbi:GNAT family N-acetyltransferase [Thalassoroseus pseudoceratinae]|uniref:GNAT family N-acetyltransferase n=1 Tax=Thalassoroseus pseudoceratinae TaxID=2713176 RepID=UPI00141FAF24|nr:GNAT family N-acetyltransferase [Thalassoroseus pseudoceratinae]